MLDVCASTFKMAPTGLAPLFSSKRKILTLRSSTLIEITISEKKLGLRLRTVFVEIL